MRNTRGLTTFSAVLLPLILVFAAGAARADDVPAVPLDKAVIKMRLHKGVTMDDAISSMKLRANMLNMKLVAHLPLSKQIEAMGKKARRMEVFQFCNPLIAQQMVESNIDFAAYLPCRIALVEDEHGQGWLVMTNLNMIIRGGHLEPKLKAKAEQVRDALMKIMKAGAGGEL